jgi:hypothetical protein
VKKSEEAKKKREASLLAGFLTVTFDSTGLSAWKG